MVMNLVLSHPTVKTWFLKPAVHHSHKDDQKRIAVMMTSFTCKTLAVIAEFEERFTEHLKGQLDMYIQELVTYICREKENLGRSSSSTMYNHLPSLLKFFSFSQQGMILDAILGQKKKSEETRGKHVDLVSHIIAHLSSTSSDPSALHLAIQSVSTLLNMAIAKNSVKFDQTLLKFLQAFPQYTVCASDSFVEYCFHEPTCTRVDMIYCLVTGSKEARRMFIDCCKRNKKVKKMKQLFVKVMDFLLFMESEFEDFIKDLYLPEFESWLFDSDQEQDETKHKVQMMIKLVHLLNQEEADQLVEKLRQIQCLSSVQIMVFHSLVKWSSAYENLSLKLKWQLALVENLVKSTTLVLSQKSEHDNQQKEMLINILSSMIKVCHNVI
ncbi:uncharacterized protein LOC106165134 [Lingula anatina]|uniref:Uncharacterized protein LOC106165134 n=1 Tax=Lingula anatina TaxID=7574 RepID=A0A1S3IKS3_LINAN|nr:uncharacterized protein LOC106165134 [Lingula anatina]|eukprot:XP_013398688.1 uncharacterized protein LOC106165134 [Lingula anatina]